MIPLLLYVPPLLGVGQLDMKQVAAVSMVQVLSASLSGVIVHNKNRFVSKSLLLYMGIANAPEIWQDLFFQSRQRAISCWRYLHLWQ